MKRKRFILNKKGMTGKEAVALLVFFFLFGIIFSVLEIVKQIWPFLLIGLVVLIVVAVSAGKQAEADRIAKETELHYG